MILEELFSMVLDVAPAELTDETNRAMLTSWDSMTHISLITAMEETYQIAFSTDEIPAIQSLGHARRLLQSKGVTI